MTKNLKNWVIFVKSHFFDKKPLLSNSLLFFENYSKLNDEHEFDAKLCSFKELMAFLSKKMTIFYLSMILGKYKIYW